MSTVLADDGHAGVVGANPEHTTGAVAEAHYPSHLHLSFTNWAASTSGETFLFLTSNFCFFLLRHDSFLRIWLALMSLRSKEQRCSSE